MIPSSSARSAARFPETQRIWTAGRAGRGSTGVRFLVTFDDHESLGHHVLAEQTQAPDRCRDLVADHSVARGQSIFGAGAPSQSGPIGEEKFLQVPLGGILSLDQRESQNSAQTA